MEWEKGNVSSLSARDSFNQYSFREKAVVTALVAFWPFTDNTLPDLGAESLWFRTFLCARNLLWKSEQSVLTAYSGFRYQLNGAREVSRIRAKLPIVRQIQFLEFAYEITHPLF